LHTVSTKTIFSSNVFLISENLKIPTNVTSTHRYTIILKETDICGMEMTEHIFMKIAPKGSDGEGGPIRNCILNQVYVYETYTLNEGVIRVRLKYKETLETLCV